MGCWLGGCFTKTFRWPKSDSPKIFQIWQIEGVGEGEGVVRRRDDDGGAGAPRSHQIPVGGVNLFSIKCDLQEFLWP